MHDYDSVFTFDFEKVTQVYSSSDIIINSFCDTLLVSPYDFVKDHDFLVGNQIKPFRTFDEFVFMSSWAGICICVDSGKEFFFLDDETTKYDLKGFNNFPFFDGGLMLAASGQRFLVIDAVERMCYDWTDSEFIY